MLVTRVKLGFFPKSIQDKENNYILYIWHVSKIDNI